MKRTVILFALGAALVFPFEYWYTLLVGIGFFLASIVSGVFSVASPEFLEGDENPSG
jgi:hypothetical protein